MRGDSLTTAEAAEVLGLSTKTVTRYCETGLIQAEKRGRDWLIETAAVLRYRAERRKPGRPKKEHNHADRDL